MNPKTTWLGILGVVATIAAHLFPEIGTTLHDIGIALLGSGLIAAKDAKNFQADVKL